MANTIFQESFETDGNGSRYTTSVPEFTDGSGDFFTRTDGSNIGSFYEVTGSEGDFFFAAQDLDGEGATLPLTLNFTEIDISGFTNLNFSALFAEDDDGTNQDWDEPDFVKVEFQIDGGGFQNLLVIENDGSTFNSAPLIDTDFDGIGDGTEITSTFTEFSNAIAGTGSTLDLRFTFDLDSGDEDIAIDKIEVTGEPSIATPDIVINEMVVSTSSTDQEFLELFGTASTSLDDVFLLELRSGGEIDTVLDFSGETLNGDGLFLAASPEAETDLGVTGDFAIADNTFTNSSQTYLLVQGFTGASGDDLDTDDDGVLDVTSWTAQLDDVAFIDDDMPLIYSNNVVGPDGTFLAPGGFRAPDGTGGFTLHDFSDNSNYTPGELNTPPTPTPSIVINEVDADTVSTDTAEFVELYDGGIGNSSLDGLTVVFFNGSDDASYDAFDLDGFSTNADGFFVLGNAGVPNVELTFSSNGLQNGADAVALYAGDGADFPNDTPVTTENLLDAIVYDTNDSDDSGLLTGLGLSEQFNEDDAGDKDTDSNSRVPDGTGTFVAQTPTPGAANESGGNGAPELKIHDIQGSGDASPLDGQTVTVEAIVVGDFQDGELGTNGDLNGFYLQEEDSDIDGDPLTSEGIFVFDGFSPSVDVSVGDKVRVAGTVDEFFGETQIDTVTNVEIISSGNSVTPATVTFPVASTLTNSDGQIIADMEAYEGMLVTIPQELTVSDLFTLGRFGDIGLHADGRLETYTQANTPSVSGFEAYQELAVRNTVTLDDGSTIQNPEVIPFEIPSAFGDVSGQLDANDELRSGDTVTDLTGVVRFGRGSGGFGDEIYRVNPIDTVQFTNTNPRPRVAPEVEGNITVSAFNVLNFFTSLDDEGLTAGPNGLSTRGADNSFEFDRQVDKLVTALSEIEADIFGLVELENEFGDVNGDGEFAIGFLVDALNDALPGANYQFVDPGTDYIGTDAISVGFIYNADTVKIADGTTVEVLSDSDLADLGVDPGNPVFEGSGTSRSPLAVTFEEIATGATFTAAVNHFKSKGSVSPFGENEGIGDGTGNNNQARLQAAIALDTWLKSDPTGSGDEDFMILGDLNAYAMEEPIQYLLNNGYEDQIKRFLETGEFEYSFGFPLDLDTSPQVQAFGALDYTLANESLADQVVDAAEWHINADEASVFDYNTNFKPDEQINGLFEENPFRASDHDPLIVGLNLNEAPIITPDQTFDLTKHPLSEGTVVGVVQATDEDNGDRLLNWQLTESNPNSDGDSEELFAIDNQGEITINDFDDIDAPHYTLTVTVEDAQGAASDPETVTVKLFNDLSDPANARSNRVFGTQHNDFVDLLGGNDRFFGGQGSDLANGNEGRDYLWGGSDHDLLNGGAGRDFLFGGRGDDQVNGGEDNDFLFGGKGDDTLRGSLGNDKLFSGEGSDIFVLAPGEGTDRIIDFELGVDLIGLADGLTFEDLSFERRSIFLENERLAIFNGALELDADDFISVSN